LANRWLGERVTPLQWSGLLGVVLILHEPAVTPGMAYVLVGERLDSVAIAGTVACAAAVFLVNRRA
jgi:drug/metabolite transporter (DMT)-like permease